MPRIAKVFLVSLVLLIILVLALCRLASYYFSARFLAVLALGWFLYGLSPWLTLPLVLGVTLATSVVSVRLVPRRLQIATVFASGCLVFTGLVLHHLHYPVYEKFTPSRAELDEVRQWLWENPPDGTNRADRRKRMAVIQKACEQLSSSVFDHEYYKDYSTYPTRTDAKMEADYPALYYLGRATDQAMDDIRKTRVKKGLAVWFLYNMGYVFKTPEKCFAIDIHNRGTERLARDLDFLLVTHVHSDHRWDMLLKQMLEAGKPVLTNLSDRARTHLDLPSGTMVNKPSEFRFGDIRVKVDIGDHGWGSSVDVLMFQVDCGESANNYTIYHTGDAANVAKMRPDKEVDIFIVHAGLDTAGLSTSVKQAIRHLKPRLTFASHVLELGHSPKLPHVGRVPFDCAFWTIRGIPTNEATVLTWGERWLAPGTVLEVEAELSE